MPVRDFKNSRWWYVWVGSDKQEELWVCSENMPLIFSTNSKYYQQSFMFSLDLVKNSRKWDWKKNKSRTNRTLIFWRAQGVLASDLCITVLSYMSCSITKFSGQTPEQQSSALTWPQQKYWANNTLMVMFSPSALSTAEMVSSLSSSSWDTSKEFDNHPNSVLWLSCHSSLLPYMIYN